MTVEAHGAAALEFDAAPVALASVDRSGSVTAWNRAAEQLLGWSADEMIGQPLPAGLPTEVRRLAGISKPGDPPVQGEATIARKGGDRRQYALSLRVNEDGGSAVALHDITAMMLERTELERDRGSYRSLLEQLPLLTYQETVSPEGVYPVSGLVYISPQVKDILGFTQEDYLNDPEVFWRDICHPDDHEGLLAEARRTIETGEPFEYEYRVIGRDGTVRWVYDASRLVEVREDGTQVWDGVNLNITERKRIEAELAASEERYRLLVERTPAITYMERVTGERYPEDIQIYTSPQVRQILGYEPSEWEPATTSFWLQRVHPEDLGKVVAEAGRCVRVGRPYVQEYRMLLADDSVIWLHDESHLVETQGDGTQLWQGVAIDITARREAEARLRETVSLLEETDRHRKDLMRQLVRAQERERQRIAADIHDDTVQSMVATSLRLDLLQRKLADPEDIQDLRIARDAVDGSMARLRSLLFDLRPAILDERGLEPALKSMAQSLSVDADTKIVVDAGLSPEPDPDVRVVVFRIVKEALENALRHAEASEIKVRIWWENRGLCFEVRDDGRGFDPTEARPGPGHLGLLTMQERAEVVGGALIVTTEPGSGTVVEGCIPAL